MPYAYLPRQPLRAEIESKAQEYSWMDYEVAELIMRYLNWLWDSWMYYEVAELIIEIA